MNEWGLNPLSLSGDSLQLWLMLCAEGGGDTVEVTRERLAEKVGKSAATVRRRLAELEEEGFIQRLSGELIQLHVRGAITLETSKPDRLEDKNDRAINTGDRPLKSETSPLTGEEKAIIHEHTTEISALRETFSTQHQAMLQELDRLSARMKAIETLSGPPTPTQPARPPSPPLPLGDEDRAEVQPFSAAEDLPAGWRLVVANAFEGARRRLPKSQTTVDVLDLQAEQVELDVAQLRAALEQGSREGWVSGGAEAGTQHGEAMRQLAPLIGGKQRGTVRVDAEKVRSLTPAWEKLKAWREKEGLRQQDVAKKMGFGSRKTYGRTESGERFPNEQERALIAKVTAGAVPADSW